MTLLSRRDKSISARGFLRFARRRWAARRRRWTVFVLLLIPTTLLVGYSVLLSFYGDAWLQPVADAQLAPPMPARVSPFRDLCDAAAALYESADNATTAHRGAQSRRLARLMDRFRHIPADGGPAGVRWSAATGLPLSSAATRRGGEGKEEDGKVEVKAHFVTISTRMDDFAQATTTAATMAGVRLNVIGVGWNWFAFTRRMELLRSFIDQDNVDEDDVLVSVDADAVFSGEDLYDSLAAFVASTAANATEHETYRVRDIRLGRRQPPVLFSAEYNCMHAQAYPSRHLCPTGYNVIDQMMSTWSQQAGVPLPSAHRRVNPFPYLNAGVVVARVWAIRRVWAASQAFMSSHTFYEGDEWWCDQSVLGSLYLQLRWWEIKSFALDAAPAQLLSTATQAECLFPPLMLPEPHRGPHGLPGGLIGLDDAGRFSLVISTQMDQKGVFQVGGTPITQSTQPEDALATYLRSGGRVEDGLTGVPRSGHRVELVPRAGFDCGGAAGHNAQAIRPPECAYRAAVLGVPGSAEAVTPLIWHFAGKYKRPLLTRFRVVFPWYTPMLWNASVRLAVLATVTAAPPTRLWYLNATTDLPFANIVHALYSHSSEDDASFEQMCELSRVRAGRTSLKNG